MDILAPAQMPANVVPNRVCALRDIGAKLDARNDRRRADLVLYDVTLVVQNHLAASPAMGEQGQLIAEGTGGNQQRRLLADQLSCVGFQLIHRRVLTIHVIPHRRFGHGPAHLRSRPGHRIGAEVYRFH